MPEYTLTIKFEADDDEDAKESHSTVEEAEAFHTVISSVLTNEDGKQV